MPLAPLWPGLVEVPRRLRPRRSSVRRLLPQSWKRGRHALHPLPLGHGHHSYPQTALTPTAPPLSQHDPLGGMKAPAMTPTSPSTRRSTLPLDPSHTTISARSRPPPHPLQPPFLLRLTPPTSIWKPTVPRPRPTQLPATLFRISVLTPTMRCNHHR